MIYTIGLFFKKEYMKKLIKTYIPILLIVFTIIIFGCNIKYNKLDNTISETIVAPIQTTIPIQPNYSIENDTEFIHEFKDHEYQIPNKLINYKDIWIEIDLSEQALYLHKSDQIISGFRISSGKPAEKEVIGKDTPCGLYKIYEKYITYPMWGIDYHYPDVPFTMFYHKEYAIHGAYWHDNFGIPVSNGCINMNVNDAEWIYNRVKKWTYVYIHE